MKQLLNSSDQELCDPPRNFALIHAFRTRWIAGSGMVGLPVSRTKRVGVPGPVRASTRVPAVLSDLHSRIRRASQQYSIMAIGYVLWPSTRAPRRLVVSRSCNSSAYNIFKTCSMNPSTMLGVSGLVFQEETMRQAYAVVSQPHSWPLYGREGHREVPVDLSRTR